MKGFIVVSSSRNFLAARENTEERRGSIDRVFFGWTSERENALRFASKRQAKLSCGIFPLAESTVEPAKLLSRREVEGETGPMVSSSSADRICQELEKRGFVCSVIDENGHDAWDITKLGKIVLREATS